MSDWQATPAPPIPELADDYKPVRGFGPLSERLDHATKEQLFALMNSGLGEPNASTSE